MKGKIIFCLVLILCGGLINFNLSARLIRNWTQGELLSASDLVVVGRPIEVKDLNETNALGWSGETFRGVETTFKVSEVLKGAYTNSEIALHHYRFENGDKYATVWIPGDSPDFVHFSIFFTNQYVLYLVKDGTDRYAPVTGQIDPVQSIKQIQGSATNIVHTP